jgi:hypothetical protein
MFYELNNLYLLQAVSLIFDSLRTIYAKAFNNHEFCLKIFLPRPSTLLLSYPGFCGTPFCIFASLLKVPIKMNFLVTTTQAPPFS